MYESAIAGRYVGALCSEIKAWGEVDKPSVVDTIYFGGGTPSLLAASQIVTRWRHQSVRKIRATVCSYVQAQVGHGSWLQDLSHA